MSEPYKYNVRKYAILPDFIYNNQYHILKQTLIKGLSFNFFIRKTYDYQKGIIRKGLSEKVT